MKQDEVVISQVDILLNRAYLMVRKWMIGSYISQISKFEKIDN